MNATTMVMVKVNLKKLLGIAILLSALNLLLAATAWAWPTDSQWLELVKSGKPIQDSESDANGGVNVVPDYTNPDKDTPAAAYVYNDGSYLYYRLRLDGDPTQGGNGVFAQFGWGFEIDIDQNADDYEWLIMCDGISQPEVISLRENTDKTGLGDPSDKAEYVAAEYPLVGNHQLSIADTSIGGDTDYFLDFRLPYAVFKATTGIDDNTLIRYFAGSSRSTNNLTDDGADLVSGSTLYEMGSDYITPFGTPPETGTTSDGTVRFVDSLDGFNDVNLASGGETIYVRVDDADQTLAVNPDQTIRVELTAPSGDSVVVILTATGVAGKFTGAVVTEEVTKSKDIDSSDTTLQVWPPASSPTDQEIITVTYIDSIDASGNQEVNRTDTITFTTTATDLALEKSVDSSVVQQSDSVQFSLTITNQGPNNASGVVVNDQLPAGLSYQASTPSVGSYDPVSGNWSVGMLNTGASATLTIDTQVSAAIGNIVNTATITVLNEIDGYAGNNSASAELYVGGTDIRISKSVDDEYPAENELIFFSVRALNLGPNNASGVVVTDLLPSGLNYDSATGYSATQGSYNEATGVWTVGDLASGVGAVLTIPARPAPGTANTILTNSASLTVINEPESNPANDSAGVDIKVNFHDLELTKMVGVGPSYNPLVDIAVPNEGDSVRYELVVTNHGPNDATGVAVTDQLPSGISFDSVGQISQGSYNPATGVWSLGALSSGSTATLQIDADVNNDTAGQTIINSAEITASDYFDDVESNNWAAATIKVDGTDLQITKTVNNSIPSPGDSATYTLTVTNNGPNPASGVAVTDILPEGVTYTSHSASAGTSYDAKSNGKPSWVWDIGNLSVTGSATLTINATVDSGTSGQNITNVGMITESDQADPNYLNNVASSVISVDGTDLAITKTVDDPTPNEHQDIIYTVTITNNGPTDATGVEVRDLLPPEVSYISSTGNYDQASGIWTIGNLSDNQTAQLNIIARVKGSTSGLYITNNASINAVDQGDQNPANDFASADVAVAGTDLALTKTIDNASPGVQGAVTYMLTVTNEGANSATGFEVEDILPAGITLISSTPSQGSYSTGSWLVGSLAAGDSATLDILVGVDGPVGTTVTNSASITGLDQTDSDPANDSASVDFTPVAWPVLTVVKSAKTVSDPEHGMVNPYDVPGAIIEYRITVTNTGLAATDADSLLLVDPIPEHTALVVTDPPVTISNVQATTGLTLTYTALNDLTDHVEFSADGTDYSQIPTADGNGTDPSVKYLRFMPAGQFNASDGITDPSFTVTFRVRLQ
ncbi:DUF11 domain-containing protein [Desulfosediminicola ganghwensis]|uniref:DUF11 domain-containing protein n=1 Tax=Desulfosediminicola ganghwensis TaxID=2569540 RepID=UPI0010AC578E|nr:DUF11 domain-containing protein [Desulfosediminicola ganghwensis]